MRFTRTGEVEPTKNDPRLLPSRQEYRPLPANSLFAPSELRYVASDVQSSTNLLRNIVVIWEVQALALCPDGIYCVNFNAATQNAF
jgi:hypothetical protein